MDKYLIIIPLPTKPKQLNISLEKTKLRQQRLGITL